MANRIIMYKFEGKLRAINLEYVSCVHEVDDKVYQVLFSAGDDSFSIINNKDLPIEVFLNQLCEVWNDPIDEKKEDTKTLIASHGVCANNVCDSCEDGKCHSVDGICDFRSWG